MAAKENYEERVLRDSFRRETTHYNSDILRPKTGHQGSKNLRNQTYLPSDYSPSINNHLKLL